MNDIAIAQRPAALPALRTLEDYVRLGEILGKSGLFADSRDASKCVVKILAGAEMGFGPLASMCDVHIIEGKPSIGAHLKAAAIKRSGRYDYRVVTLNKAECSLEFFERSIINKMEPVGRVSMTFAEAVSSGLALSSKTDKDGKPIIKHNWAVHPDDMLFARCVSKGFRRFCADLTGGVLAYDPDELDAAPEPTAAEAVNITASTVEASQSAEPPAEPVTLSADQVARLLDAAVDAGVEERTACQPYLVNSFADLPPEHFDSVLAAIAKAKETRSASASGTTITREQQDAIGAAIGGVVKLRGVSSKDYVRRLNTALGIERLGLMPPEWAPLVLAICRESVETNPPFEPERWVAERFGGKPFAECDLTRRELILRQHAA